MRTGFSSGAGSVMPASAGTFLICSVMNFCPYDGWGEKGAARARKYATYCSGSTQTKGARGTLSGPAPRAGFCR